MPKQLWGKFSKVGGINEDDFFKYYKNSKTGFSIIIDSVEKFTDSINPSDFFDNFCAPQSYFYLEEKTATNIVSKN